MNLRQPFSKTMGWRLKVISNYNIKAFGNIADAAASV